jgi:hypothetical protein
MTGDAAVASESTPTGVRVLVADDDVVICRQMQPICPVPVTRW